MGLIYQEPHFDDVYSQEIIAKARELSPELDEWVVTQRYLQETIEENLTPLWMRNRLLVKLVEQLNDRGIFFNQDTDDLLDSPVLIDAILTLRSKFDQDRLYDFLKYHQSLREELAELLDDDCIEDVIDCCSRTMQLDEGWESLSKLLANRVGILRSTGDFNTLLTQVFDRCELLGDECIVPESDMDKMLEYSRYLAERKTKISSIAQIIYSSNESGQQLEDLKEIAAETMSSFEKELSRPSALRQFIDDREFTPKSFIEKRRSFFVSKWRHCFEYWISPEHQNLFPSDLEVAILVATLYTDAPDQEHARVYVVETFENLIDQLGDRYEKFREMIDKALGNLVIVEGGVNNATI